MGVSKLVFTVDRLNRLPAPSQGRTYHYDKKTAGLCVCVTHTGTTTFYLYRKIDGRPQRIRLGRFPDLSIDAARKAADKLAGEIAQGLDPAADRRARREQPVLEDLYNHWMVSHARLHKRPRSIAEDERQYRSFLSPWGKRRLGTITKADAQALHARIGRDNGIYAANRLLAFLRAMFNKSAELGFTGPNPTAGIRKFKEVPRDRFILPDELPLLFQSIHQEDDLFRVFFILSLLPGARRSNVQAMQWQDVNLGLRIWRIPDTKGGEPVVVPLVDPAVRILQARLEASDDKPWVFATHSRTGHLVEPKTAWRRIVERAGLKDVRVHDLRRTLASFQALSGSSLPIIGKSLGHKQSASTQIYARLELGSVRRSVETAVEAMYEAGGVRLLEEKGESDE